MACCNRKYPTEIQTHLKYKSILPITQVSIAQSLWNFAQSMAVILPCFVQNCKMIGQTEWMLWTNEILVVEEKFWRYIICYIVAAPSVLCMIVLRHELAIINLMTTDILASFSQPILYLSRTLLLTKYAHVWFDLCLSQSGALVPVNFTPVSFRVASLALGQYSAPVPVKQP